VKGIIFDVGGVLRDSSGEAMFYSFQQAFESLGVPYTLTLTQTRHLRALENINSIRRFIHAYLVAKEELASLLDLPYQEAYQRAQEYLSQEVDQDLVHNIHLKFHEIRMKPEVVSLIKPIPKNRTRFLEQLSRQFPLGIVTNSRRATLENELGEDLRFFKAIIAHEDLKHKKPHPEGLLKASQALGIKPSQGLYVGDSVSDYRAAQAAHMPFIAVLTGSLNQRWAKDLGILTLPDVSYLLISEADL